MEVTVVTQYFEPENFLINDVVAELAAKGHHVTVLTGMPNYPSGCYSSGYGGWRVRRESRLGASVVRVPMLPRRNASPLRLLFNYLSFAVVASLLGPFLLRKRSDCIFVYQVSPLTVGLPAVVLRLLWRTPVVMWVQDVWPESLCAIELGKSAWIQRGARALARFIYRHCSLLLVQSPAIAKNVQQLCPSKPVCYLPNMAPACFDLPSVPERCERDAGGEFKVVFGGSIGESQDFETVLRTAEYLREHPGIQWFIYGEGRRKAWLCHEVDRRGLSSTLHVIESQTSDRMPAIFVAADALLLCLPANNISKLTIPSKLQAYLASGRPIVAAIEGPSADIIAEAGVGISVSSGDAKALAAAIRRLHDMSAAERAAMGAAGRNYFEQHFQRTVLIDQLVSHLSGVCSQSRAPASESVNAMASSTLTERSLH